MEINEYKISLKGTANIPQDLTLEKDVDMTIKNTETTTSKLIPNGDGTADKIITLKITERSEITILAENEIIKIKKKGSQSQVLRNTLYRLYEEQYMAEIEWENFYTKEMSKIIKEVESRFF